MAEVMLALVRSMASLRSPKIWGYILAPALFSFVLWVALAFWGLGYVVDQIMAYPPMTVLVSWGIVWLAHILAYLGGWMAIFAAAYLTASLLSAIIILPLMLKHLAQNDYRDVAAQGADNFVASTVNSLLAAVLFIAAWVLTLPLWLIPGLSIVIPMLLMGWLNRKTFAYDALSMHATDEEWQLIRRQYKRPMFMLGFLMALLAHVPILGLFIPSFAALAFIHFTLEVLRRSRGDGSIIGEAVRVAGDDDLRLR